MSDILVVPPRTLPLSALPYLVGPLSVPTRLDLSVLTYSGIASTLVAPPTTLPISILKMSA